MPAASRTSLTRSVLRQSSSPSRSDHNICSHQGERVTSIPVPPHWRHFMRGQCANGLTSRIPSSLSVALVSRHGAGPTNLTGVTLRPIQDPSDIGQCDDILLFYGARMAQEVKRFATEIKGELPPVMILAPSLDWSDVCLALRHGARCYLLENQYTAPLEELLVCACQGVCFLDPAISARICTSSPLQRKRTRCGADTVMRPPPWCRTVFPRSPCGSGRLWTSSPLGVASGTLLETCS